MKNSRIIFVGDVHGCITELNLLLAKLNLSKSDKIIFIGDLIDKGPDSVAVVKRYFELKKVCDTRLILGNHEEKFLRYLKHIEAASGKEKEMKGISEFPALILNLNAEHLLALHEAYYTLYFPQYSIVALHGGLCGKLHFEFPKDYQYNIHSQKEFYGLELITKTRFLNSEGKFVSLGAEKEEDKFWAEQYDGKYGKVVFGHQPFIQENPMIFPHAFGIDTGCVFGGWLTAMIVDCNETHFVQVKALETYKEVRG
jgi:serine/threonine protein phosphatase 1